jgi:hypothetical protein
LYRLLYSRLTHALSRKDCHSTARSVEFVHHKQPPRASLAPARSLHRQVLPQLSQLPREMVLSPRPSAPGVVFREDATQKRRSFVPQAHLHYVASGRSCRDFQLRHRRTSSIKWQLSTSVVLIYSFIGLQVSTIHI